ncbi:hypothetical protein NGB58_04235 [Escherichia coli]|nr:hypothetical protein [Escherichia coli]
MTAYTFRQVREYLNLSSDDDLLSLIANVSPWEDSAVDVGLHPLYTFGVAPGSDEHDAGFPLSLDGDDDRYISEEVGPFQVRLWVKREDFRGATSAHRDQSLTFTVYNDEYRPAWWREGDEETEYGIVPDSQDIPPHIVRLWASGAFRIWGLQLAEDSVTFRLAPRNEQCCPVMPLYMRAPRPLPDAFSNAMTIWGDGFNRLKKQVSSFTSDADTPPAKKDTPAADPTGVDDGYITVLPGDGKKTEQVAHNQGKALTILIELVLYKECNIKDHPRSSFPDKTDALAEYIPDAEPLLKKVKKSRKATFTEALTLIVALLRFVSPGKTPGAAANELHNSHPPFPTDRTIRKWIEWKNKKFD